MRLYLYLLQVQEMFLKKDNQITCVMDAKSSLPAARKT